jgi:hypothetical protein
MPKKKLKKQSGAALLSEVKKEMAQPRAAASTQSEILGAWTLVVARAQKTGVSESSRVKREFNHGAKR